MLIVLNKRLFVTAFLFSIVATANAQVKFNSPMPGVQGQDYWIVNYIDHDLTGMLLDNECGNKTYDGHEGTDFVLRSFKTMDSGVAVYAMADGIVTQTKDSLFDRSKQKNNGGLGNYVGINHSNQYWAYYGHLKKYSLTVKVGDTVKAGDTIGMVGSSGNSTDPHLHLEVYDINSNIVDPFAGTCQTNNTTLWASQPSYDTSLIIIDKGISGYVPDLDTLRERYGAYEDPIYIDKDTAVNVWVQLQGIRKGDTQRVDWYDTSGNMFFTFSYTTPQDYWYYYFWSYINVPPEHTWGKHYNVKYYINNVKYADMDFTIARSLDIADVEIKNNQVLYPNPVTDMLHFSVKATSEIVLFNSLGKKLSVFPKDSSSIDLSLYPSGVYYIKVDNAVRRISKL